jgi:hypothetical protein
LFERRHRLASPDRVTPADAPSLSITRKIKFGSNVCRTRVPALVLLGELRMNLAGRDLGPPTISAIPESSMPPQIRMVVAAP